MTPSQKIFKENRFERPDAIEPNAENKIDVTGKFSRRSFLKKSAIGRHCVRRCIYVFAR